MKYFKPLFGTLPNFWPRSVHRITVDHPLIIASPRIGFFNLMGPAAHEIVEEDKATLAPLFLSLEEGDVNPPVCDVLMIYAEVLNDGRLFGTSDSLREIIQKSHAPIVIVASDNAVKNYVAAGKLPGNGKANLVMTRKRKGAAFTSFFAQLFQRMSEGMSMPMAWVELAPQIGGDKAHENCPETIFSAEVSHIIFQKPP